MTSDRSYRARILGAVGTVLLVAGAIAIVVAVRAQQRAPQPPQSAASPVAVIPSVSPAPEPSASTMTGASASTTTGASASTTTGASASTMTGTSANSHQKRPAAGSSREAAQGPILPRSLPMHLSVPAIGVNTDLNRIGLTPGGQIQTPPLVRDSHAYWLTVSPTPGQLGPATIIGHVDSAAYGPGVFFRLGALRQRDTISITRADGIVAVFEVQRVVAYRKAQFPTVAVYGNTDDAALRLITCGGLFDPSQGSYESNIVAFAALVSTHRVSAHRA